MATLLLEKMELDDGATMASERQLRWTGRKLRYHIAIVWNPGFEFSASQLATGLLAVSGSRIAAGAGRRSI